MSAAEFAEPGRWLDVTSEPPSTGTPARGPTPPARSFVGIHFSCCDVYSRVYLNDERDSYLARCPRCLRGMKLVVDPTGSTARFFEAS
ncbi:MAG: hypothetical protein JNM18_08740 [Planctomycetaceae bacterium]|nr:hypothetical protein [Planctomycetaceae bacterium]